MNIPEHLFYTDSHEWISLDGDIATVGITDFAQSELGDIIFLEFTEINMDIEYGEPFGTIEAIKTVADLSTPVSGKILEVNTTLEDSPEKVNEDPYGEGWLVKIKYSNQEEIEKLLSKDDYEKIIA
ncbi:MAG: glycine cleavage system protein GcvH [Candidatus Marinimicrobia bacterium]|nr:glycine cleavage system protein GcvH [Candidatus Neomarinimicrobiota bacterium]MCH8069560.1 glycine cleavage system protein GcvH [Candidatus Neomarinimicrobiota bacterium]